MISLTLSEAFEFVRKSLDEQDMSDNLAASILGEDKDLYSLVESTLEEVALSIHESAPSHLVSGLKEALKEGKDSTKATLNVEDKVGTITLKEKVARVVSVCAPDSYVVTEFFAEDSVEAHKQKNKYVRGTADRPRAVLYKGEDYCPVIKYYSFGSAYSNQIVLEYIPYPTIVQDKIMVSYQLKYPLLNWLVAAILEIVGEVEKAQLWKSKFKVE